MHKFAVILLVGVAAAARLDNTYLPPTNARYSGGNQEFLSIPFQQNTFGKSYQSPNSRSFNSGAASTFGGPERYQSPFQRSSYNDPDSISTDSSEYNGRYQSPNPFSEDIGSVSGGYGQRGYQSGQGQNQFQGGQLGRQYLPPTQQQSAYHY